VNEAFFDLCVELPQADVFEIEPSRQLPSPCPPVSSRMRAVVLKWVLATFSRI
jgi:hypothetical protein